MKLWLVAVEITSAGNRYALTESDGCIALIPIAHMRKKELGFQSEAEAKDFLEWALSLLPKLESLGPFEFFEFEVPN